METIFATHCGGVCNTAVISSAPQPAPVHSRHSEVAGEASESGLGGQIAEVMASINAVGWNHNQVPEAERVPPQERELEHEAAGAGGHPSGPGGQIGELVAALDQIGWNHNQVPPEERVPLQERV